MVVPVTSGQYKHYILHITYGTQFSSKSKYKYKYSFFIMHGNLLCFIACHNRYDMKEKHIFIIHTHLDDWRYLCRRTIDENETTTQLLHRDFSQAQAQAQAQVKCVMNQLKVIALPPPNWPRLRPRLRTRQQQMTKTNIDNMNTQSCVKVEWDELLAI